jgi:hypothetical protein
MDEKRPKWKSEKLIEDVEHYGKKLKAEQHLFNFNQLLTPNPSPNNNNTGLIIGLVALTLSAVFLTSQLVGRNEQKPQEPTYSPNLQTLPLAP